MGVRKPCKHQDKRERMEREREEVLKRQEEEQNKEEEEEDLTGKGCVIG